MRYLLLLAVLCWPVRAEYRECIDGPCRCGTNFHLNESGIAICSDGKPAYEEPKPQNNDLESHFSKPLTTRWVKVQEYPSDDLQKCMGKVMGHSFENVDCRPLVKTIELGLQDDGNGHKTVVWR